MKFIRNGRIRDRIVDFASKALLLAFSVLFCLWMISGAKAAEISDIQQRALDDGGYLVEFKFSDAIAKDNINVEYDRNFIQISVKGLSAFPAKTKTLNYSILDKAFTYQYQPDLARVRILLKTSAASIQNKSNWEVSDRGVKIFFQGASVSTASIPKSKDIVKVTSSAASETVFDPADEQAVKQIIQDVKDPTKKITAAPTTSPINASVAAESSTKNINSEELPLFGNATNSDPASIESKDKKNPGAKIFATLLMVIGLIGAGALAFRRFSQGKVLGFTRANKMIDVISSQSMGPKKSIAIVKVLDQYMVIGMAGDNMNLLANLGANVNIEKQLDEAGPGSSFSKTFQTAMSTDASPVQTATTQKAPSEGIRSLIKKRMEGFKPL